MLLLFTYLCLYCAFWHETRRHSHAVRKLQSKGIAAALVMSGTLSLLTQMFPNPIQRARVIGLWSTCGSLAIAGVATLIIAALTWSAISPHRSVQERPILLETANQHHSDVL